MIISTRSLNLSPQTKTRLAMEKIGSILSNFFQSIFARLEEADDERIVKVAQKIIIVHKNIVDFLRGIEELLDIQDKKFFWWTFIISSYATWKLNAPSRDIYLQYSSIGQWSAVIPIIFFVVLNNGPMRNIILEVADLRHQSWNVAARIWFGITLLITIAVAMVWNLTPWVPGEFWYFGFDFWICFLALLGILWLWLIFVSMYKFTGKIFGFRLCEKVVSWMSK